MVMPHTLRSVRWGTETVPSGDHHRHYHREAYATVVLAGRFVETSFAGRSSVEPGDVLLHAAFDAHANVGASRQQPTILRLPWFGAGCEGRFRIADPDALASLAERDPFAARDLLARRMVALPDVRSDWVEQLAGAMRDGPIESITYWAEANRLSPETVSRGFGRAFQVSPKLFRLETRTRVAWKAIVGGHDTLTSIAHQQGFADLAHMSRSIRRMTGASPAQWRALDDPGQVRSSFTPSPMA